MAVRPACALIESCYMDFTPIGSRGEAGGFSSSGPAVRAAFRSGFTPAGGKRRIMSSFAGDPQDGTPPEHQGPLLVMPPPQQPKRPSVWLKRLWLAIFVLFCLEVGIILIVLPWSRVWSENSLVIGHPQLAGFLQQNFIRGLISGLGLVDVLDGNRRGGPLSRGPRYLRPQVRFIPSANCIQAKACVLEFPSD